MYAKNRKLAKRNTPSKPIEDYFPPTSESTIDITTSSEDDDDDDKIVNNNNGEELETSKTRQSPRQALSTLVATTRTTPTTPTATTNNITTSLAHSSLRLKRRKANPPSHSQEFSEMNNPNNKSTLSSSSENSVGYNVNIIDTSAATADKNIIGDHGDEEVLNTQTLDALSSFKGNELKQQGIITPPHQIEQNEGAPSSLSSIMSPEQQQENLYDSNSSNNASQSVKVEEEFTKISSRIEENVNPQLAVNDISILSRSMVGNERQVIPSSLMEEEEIHSSPIAFFATFRDETVLVYHAIHSVHCEPSLLITKIRSKIMDLPKDIVVKYWDDYVGGFVRFDQDVVTYIMKSNFSKVKLLISQKI